MSKPELMKALVHEARPRPAKPLKPQPPKPPAPPPPPMVAEALAFIERQTAELVWRIGWP
jgi:hypothetical protein